MGALQLALGPRGSDKAGLTHHSHKGLQGQLTGQASQGLVKYRLSYHNIKTPRFIIGKSKYEILWGKFYWILICEQKMMYFVRGTGGLY